MRKFRFTVTITDPRGRIINEIHGHTDIDDHHTPEPVIAQNIVNGLPGNLRHPDFSHRVALTPA